MLPLLTITLAVKVCPTACEPEEGESCSVAACASEVVTPKTKIVDIKSTDLIKNEVEFNLLFFIMIKFFVFMTLECPVN